MWLLFILQSKLYLPCTKHTVHTVLYRIQVQCLMIWFICFNYGIQHAKPFFHVRVHKITTYNTSTYNKSKNACNIHYKCNNVFHTTDTTYNISTYNMQWQPYNYNILIKYLYVYKDCDKNNKSLKSCCSKIMSSTLWEC